MRILRKRKQFLNIIVHKHNMKEMEQLNHLGSIITNDSRYVKK